MLDKLIFDRTFLPSRILSVVLAVVLVVGISTVPPYALGGSDASQQDSEATLETAEASTDADDESADEAADEAADVKDEASGAKAESDDKDSAEEDDESEAADEAADEASEPAESSEPEQDIAADDADDDANDEQADATADNAEAADSPAAASPSAPETEIVLGETPNQEEEALLSTAAIEEGEEAVAHIGSEPYASFEAALEAAAAGDTISLDDDVVLEDTVAINKNLTLNLAGKTVTYKGSGFAFDVTGSAKFSVKDGEAVLDNASSAKGLFQVASAASLALADVKLIGTNGMANHNTDYALVYLASGSAGAARTVALDGVTAETDFRVLASALGSTAANNAAVTVRGGNFVRTYVGGEDEGALPMFYLNGANAEFNGVTIDAKQGTCLFAEGNADSITLSGNNNFTTSTAFPVATYSSAALSIENGTYVGGIALQAGDDARVAISGGTFRGTVQVADGTPQGAIVITGGTFESAPDAGFIPKGYRFDTASSEVVESGEQEIELKIENFAADLAYTGSAQTPEFTVTTNENQPLTDSDYQVTYAVADVEGNNAALDSKGLPLNAGAYTVTVTGSGTFADAQKAVQEFSIDPAEVDLAIAEIGEQKYTGKQLTPAVDVTARYADAADAIEGFTADDYTVSYGENTELGADTGTVTVTAKGNYSGTATATFGIIELTDAETIAQIGSVKYPSLAEAVAAATAGQTVTLLKDVILDENLVFSDKLELDLGGNTVTVNAAEGFTAAKGADVTLRNGVIETLADGLGDADVITADAGTITLGSGLFVNAASSALYAHDGGIINLAGATVTCTSSTYIAAYILGNGSCLNVGGGTLSTDNVDGLTTVSVDKNATVNVTGGSIASNSAKQVTLYVFGENARCNISGGTVSGEDMTALSPCNGVTTVSGNALITSKALYTVGAYANNAVFNMIGGTIENTGGAGEHYGLFASKTATANVSGGTISTEGAYGVILNDGGTANISGGTVLGGYALGKTSGSTFAVSGGEFSTPVAASYCADGFIPVYDMNANGHYGVKQGVAVARIGGKVYESLAEAVAEAVDGNTVYLLADTKEYIDVNLSGAITLDLGGNTLSAAAPADSATSNDKAVALHVQGGTLAVKNGSIVSDSAYAIWAMNSSSVVTLANDVAVTSAGYGLFVEFGAKGVVSGSTIVGGNDECAALAVAGQNSTLAVSAGLVTGKDGAVAAESSNGAQLAIAGGTFSSTGEALASENDGTIAVSGGWFTNAVAAGFCATGWAPSETANSEGLYTVIEDLQALAKAEQAADELIDALAASDAGDGASWNQVIAASYLYQQAVEAVNAFQDVENGLAKGSYEARIAAVQKKLAGITKLDMANKNIAENTVYDGTDAGALAVYTGLTALDLSNTGVTDFGAIAGLDSLKDLSLANAGVGNEVFGVLVGLTQLERLDLSGNKGITAMGPLTTNGDGASACAQSLQILNVSNTGITQLQEVWNASQKAASLPALKTLVADGLELSSISGLVEIVNASGFNADGILWRLGGSALLSDPDSHVGMIQDKFAGTQGTFIPPITAVAKIDGGSYYGSVSDAIEAASDGATIILQTNATEAVDVSKSVTIDLGGHTLTAPADASALVVSGELVTVKNGTVRGAEDSMDAITMVTPGSRVTLGQGLRVVSSSELGFAAWVTADHATLVIDGASVESDSEMDAVYLDGSCSLVLADGSIKAAGTAISANGGAQVEIEGGAVSTADSSNEAAISANDANTSLKVSGGLVTAQQAAVSLDRGATASVTGGELSSVAGAALQLNGRYSEATVSGGEVTGFSAGIKAANDSTLYVRGNAVVTATGGEAEEAIDADYNAKVEVSGGWFSHKLMKRYCADDFSPTEAPASDPEGYYTVTRSYKVAFMSDGELLQETKVLGGTMPVYEGDAPFKAADAQYTYTFKGWDRELAPATEDATYNAVYEETLNVYTVTFQDEDGTLLATQEAEYGSIPSYAGEEPAKSSDGQHVYSFAGWEPQLAAVTDDVTYTARYTEGPATFTVTWANDDGAVLSSQTVEYGAMPSYEGETPTKAADAQYTYTFSGWNGDLEQGITGDVTFTAQYGKSLNSYTVRFVNDDGTQLSSQTLEYGATPSYEGETPAKAADAQYTYTFSGWDKTFGPVDGNTTYTAQYSAALNSYTVVFANDDGTELQRSTMDYGAMPSYNGATPVKGSTAQHTYTFKGWDAELAAVTGEVTYTATYTQTTNEYTVRFLNDDGSVLDTLTVRYGSLPAYMSESPVKAGNAQYTYAFAGWSPEIVPVTGNADYTATYTQTTNEYTVSFVNEDGTVLQRGQVAYGQVPSYEAAVPAKAATAQYTYTFKGWDAELAAVTGDATYTATYDSAVNSYRISWVDDNGAELNAQTLAYGATPNYSTVPTKASDGANVYRFAGWSPQVSPVTGNQTYRATYSYLRATGGNAAVSLEAGSTRALGVTASSAVTWTSSNPAFATVSASGVVTAVAPGTATITATTADGLAVSYPVTVRAASSTSSDNGGTTTGGNTNNTGATNGNTNTSGTSGSGSASSSAGGNGSAGTAATNAGSTSATSAGTTASTSNGSTATGSNASGATTSSNRSNGGTSGATSTTQASAGNTANTTMGNATGTTVGATTTAAGANTGNTGAANAVATTPSAANMPVVATDTVAADDNADATEGAAAEEAAAAEAIEDDPNALAAAPGSSIASETIDDDANALSGGNWDAEDAGVLDGANWWLWLLAAAAAAGLIWFLLAKRRKDDDEEEAAVQA